MSQVTDVAPSLLVQALKENWTMELLTDKLMLDGHDEVSVDLLLREYKKLKNTKRQNTGFVLLAIGAFLGLLSCLLTIFNPFPELFDLILYGFTSIAIIIAFIGLYYIFE
ncbi:MAG: hypothetical protein V4561_05620 [Bacteroidota bacterium]